MMPAPPDTFLTIATLKSLAGQVGAVLLLTQVAKQAWPTLPTYYLRLIAVGTAIVIHGVLNWHAGMFADDYILSGLNGMLVALTAMKAAEFLKGNSA